MRDNTLDMWTGIYTPVFHQAILSDYETESDDDISLEDLDWAIQELDKINEEDQVTIEKTPI